MVRDRLSKVNWDEMSFKVIFNMIYDDELEKAYVRLDEWSNHQNANQEQYTANSKVKDERIFNLMKLLSYCNTEGLMSKSARIEPGEDTYRFWQKEWVLFEEFIKENQLYYEENYLGFKHFFYQKMINNLILEFNSQSYYTPIMLDTCKRLLEIGSLEKAEEGFNYIKKKSDKFAPEVELLLVELYYRNEKKSQAMRLLKDIFFTEENINAYSLPIDEVKTVIKELFLSGYQKAEINLWLPVYLRLKEVLPVLYTLDLEEYKKAVIKVNELEKSSYQNEYIHQARLVYGYIYIMDQLKTRIIKGKEYLVDDLNNYLKKLESTSPFFYQKFKNFYEAR